MPTHYVEDFDGERNDDAVDAPTLKVVEAADEKPAANKTSRAKTK